MAETNIVIRVAESTVDRTECMRIRFVVFVDEQKVSPELEVDGIDDECLHYLANSNNVAVGTARVIPKGETAKIGRVAVLKSHRGLGTGLALMEFVVSDVRMRGFELAVLDSQTYAIPFYEKLGFVAGGDEFLDADIPHYRMTKLLREATAL